MAIQRYSFGTQKPDRDSEGDFVKYEDVKHLLEPGERREAGKTTDAQRTELLNHEQPEGPSWNNQ
jgi:hypothetical protein